MRSVSTDPLAGLSGTRHWFWSRKPDRGFWLEGFPRSRLEALVLDEWLEARGESLTACFCPSRMEAAEEGTAGWIGVAEHYRRQGLLVSLEAEGGGWVDAALAKLEALLSDR